MPLCNRLNGLAGPLAFLEERLRGLDHFGIVDILRGVQGGLGLFDNLGKGAEQEKVNLLVHGGGDDETRSERRRRR